MRIKKRETINVNKDKERKKPSKIDQVIDINIISKIQTYLVVRKT